MYFSYRTTGFASVTSTKLRGERGIGPILALDVAVIMQPKTAARPNTSQFAPVIVAIHGSLGVSGLLLAPLELAFVEWVCVDYAQQNNVALRAYLSHDQIRTIDAMRAADGGLDVEIALIAQVNGHQGLLPAPYATMPIREKVTASDWTRILKEMHFEDRATFDVPVEGGRVGPPLDKAAAHMRAALDKVQHRQWDDALTKAREVLTELQQHLPVAPPAWADWGDKTKREGWDLLERVAAAHAAVRHTTHAGAHASIGAASEHEVRLVVTMTGALLRYVASR